jgi:hypothetical protein
MSTSILVPFAGEAGESLAVSERYRSAYQAARKAASFAESIRYGSIFLAGVVIIAAILVRQAIPSERFDFPIISLSMVTGVVLLALIANLWSTIFQVQARMLEIAIDAAVNSSPFLSNAQRAVILGATQQPSVSKAAGTRTHAA